MCVLPAMAIGGKSGGGLVGGLLGGIPGALIGSALAGKKGASTPTGQPFLGNAGTIQPTSPSPAGSSY